MDTQASADGLGNLIHDLKQPRVLSCAQCQKRKVKCDRCSPCSNCAKAEVLCTPSTPAPARKRRATKHDLLERVERCEALLRGYAPVVDRPQTPSSSNHVPDDPPGASFEPSSSAQELNASYITTRNDGSVRFTDSFGTVVMHEELVAIQNSIKSDGSADEGPIESIYESPYKTLPVTEFESSASDTPDTQPGPVEAMNLWEHFLERVNPLTKIVHVPTLEPYVMRAAVGMHLVPIEYQALLYSIYAMAVISMSEQECFDLLGHSRDTMLKRYGGSTKRALMKYNHRENYIMITLQTLILYLLTLEDRIHRHASWVTSGIVVRMAYSMGYHRDGECLGLGPFETEMRRRIWCQIIIQDAKNALLSGLSAAMLPMQWDTKPPLNINDADMSPGSDSPIVSREGPTEMAYVLVARLIYAYKIDCDNHIDTPINEAILLGMSLTNDENTDRAVFGKFREQSEELRRALESYTAKYIGDGAGKVHVAATILKTTILEKLDDALSPIKEQEEWGIEIFNWKDNLFKMIMLSMEYQCNAHDKMAAVGFEWYMRLQFYPDMLASLTSQLYRRPMGSLSDRGWRAVERLHGHYPELFDMSQRQQLMQAQFTLKAWEARKIAVAQRGGSLETPAYIVLLGQALSEMEAQKAEKPIDWNALWTDLQPFGDGLNSFMGEEFVQMSDGPSARGHGLV
ncbi:C6 zinc finger domain-containing protein, partial [Metarhizium majus ARSEF 297]